MTKKDFIALADAIKRHNELQAGTTPNLSFGPVHINTLANFCQLQSPAFNRERWLNYIAGKCGPNGGTVR
jgi:hypothetical protein